MKRAYPQRVKLDAFSASGIDETTGQIKQAPEVNRRAYTSAAAIGLAISMGASGLLMPQQNDGAIASEPVPTEPTIANLPPAVEPSAVAPKAAVESPTASEVLPEQATIDNTIDGVIEHTVRAGQTLWQLSRIYGVTIEQIASLNGITPTATLYVGQVLRVPSQGMAINSTATSANEAKGSIEPISFPEAQIQPVAAPATEVASASIKQLAEPQDAEPTLRGGKELSSSEQVIAVIPVQLEAPTTKRQVVQTLPSPNIQSNSPIFSQPPVLQASATSATSSESLVIQFGAPLPTATSADPTPGEVKLVAPPATSDAKPEVSLPASPRLAPSISANPSVNGDTMASAAAANGEIRNAAANDSVAVALRSPSGVSTTEGSTPNLSLRQVVPAIVDPQLQPSPSAVPPAVVVPGAPISYRVQRGDTLAKIAQANNVPISEIISSNRISDPNFIFVNQVLRIRPRRPAVEAVRPLPQPTQPTLVAASQVDLRDRGLLNLSGNATSPTLPGANRQAEPLATGTPGNRPESSASVLTLPNLPNAAQRELPIVPVPATRTAKPQVPTLRQVASAPVARPAINQPEFGHDSQFSDGSRVSPYTENLRIEIVRLREKYASQGNASAVKPEVEIPVEAPTTVAVAPERVKPGALEAARSGNGASLPLQGNAALPSGRLNPEFRPAPAERASEPSAIAVPSAPATSPVASGSPDASIVAVAPVGSESYAPLVQPLVGQTVSPKLPPLGAADRFLPGAASTFTGYIWPTQGILTSGYGWRWGRMHRGIDIAAPVGTPIVAAAPGVVVTAGWNSGGYGNLVEIEHPDGSLTLYAHNSRILVQEGQQVEQGELIAEVGSTGYSTGPHLHLEIHLPKQGAINPISLLPAN